MRGFLFMVAFSVGAGAAVLWYSGFLPDLGMLGKEGAAKAADVVDRVLKDPGPLLYPAAPPGRPAINVAAIGQVKDPIVIDGHNVILEKQDVPSRRGSQLLFIGEPIANGIPPAAGPVGTAKMFQDGKEVLLRYRPLEEGARVTEDQIVAMLDHSVALNDWMIKKAKIDAARAEFDAAGKTRLEAQARLDRMEQLRLQGKNFVTPEEYSAAVLARDRYRYDEVAKKAAITQAELDAEQALLILKEHEIRNKIPGVSILKTIHKHRGEAVKEQETILQLYNVSRLRAEGLIDIQYLDQIREGMRVSLEPIEEQPPSRMLNEHRGEITSIAVSGVGDKATVVSASADGTLRVWSPTQARALRVLYPPLPASTIACNPEHGGRRWLLAGSAGGRLFLWDLDSTSDQPAWDSGMSEHGPHGDTITALAFSPDGKWFATGGEDGTLALWQTEGYKLRYAFDAEHGVKESHAGAITSLHFTPQCELISAGRDNTLRIWKLHQRGPRAVGAPVTGRHGRVVNLGVSRDGQWALFDMGKTIHVLSLPDCRTFSVIQGSGGSPFETLALFSPDASLVLTGGLSEGRLQLWRAPTDGKRGFELRQFATPERSPVTCAAFSPDGSFAVSGTKDGAVYVWSLPDRARIARHRLENLKLTLIERSLEVSTRLARIGVNVQNPIDAEYPSGRLIPGRPVHIVIEPE
jgi:WD40 repeat protein